MWSRQSDSTCLPPLPWVAERTTHHLYSMEEGDDNNDDSYEHGDGA